MVSPFFESGIDITPTDLGYLAGIIDGEGCISLATRGAKYITPTVQVTNTDKRLVLWLADHCGGAIYGPHHDGRPTRKPTWLWTVAGQKARTVIEAVRTLLILKREQADLVLAAYAANGRRPGRDSLGRLCGSLTAEDLANNKRAIESIRALNRRGLEV
jgi:hypothetical protein